MATFVVDVVMDLSCEIFTTDKLKFIENLWNNGKSNITVNLKTQFSSHEMGKV